MLKFIKPSLFFSLLLVFSFGVKAQGPDCTNADPFCTGTTPTFPNTTGGASLGQIGCLGSSPNPAWFYMEIDQAGQMVFTINQTDANGSGLDVDFILWGPYPSLTNACASNLLSNSGVDCSYSGTSLETATIPNAQPGEVYVLLLTNFSGQPGTIQFSQTGGTGSADCSLLCGVTGFTANAGACNPATNQYTVSGTLSITNPPLTGTLTITNSCGGSQVFNAPFAANINYSFPGLAANGTGCTVSAAFSANASCNTTVPYTAPPPCNVVACAINSLTAASGAPSCPAATFSVGGQVTFTNAPATGTLTVSSTCGGSQVFNAPFISPLNYTLTGLPANGANCTVTAVFSATPACTANTNIVSPICPTVNAGPDQVICPGDCVTLNGTSTGTASVVWTPATGLSNPNIINPQACPLVTTTYTLTGTSAGGQTAIDQVTVTISSPLNATISPAGPFCASNPAVILTAVDPGGNWSGPGITNAITGEFTPAAAGAGTHTVQYLIPGSCGDTSTIQIQVIPDANASITAAGPFCVLNAPVNLTGAEPGGTWTGTGITNGATGTFDPGVAGAGTHVITYTIVGVCGDAQTTSIIVNPQTPATINAAGPFCINNGPVTLTAITPGGTWSGVGITNPANGTFNPAAAGAGNHTVTYISAGNCSDTSTTSITVNPLPQVGFTADVTAGCSPVCVVFTDNTTISNGTIAQWDWLMGDGAGAAVQHPTHCYTNPAYNTVAFDVSLTATSAAGCTASQTVANMISAHGIPNADFTFGPQPTTILYPEISFANLSLGASVYNWDFAGLGSSSQEHPMFIFPDDTSGTYDVCLNIISANGCVDTICHVIDIDEQFSMYVPNAFTPNGDGTNDIFYPVSNGMDLQKFEFFIFNRWGEVVFQSTDASKGWDGTSKNVKAKSDVYVWKIKARDATYGEKKIYYGHVNLLR